METDKNKTNFVDSRRKNLGQPCVDLNDPNIKKMLSENKGRFKKEYFRSNLKIIIDVRWNKEKFMFRCSIIIFEKQNDGSWEHKLRFDDSHGFRHMDMENVKMPSGKFTLLKAECPILCTFIDSLPEEQGDRWKTKLFDEFEIGIQKWREFLQKIHSL